MSEEISDGSTLKQIITNAYDAGSYNGTPTFLKTNTVVKILSNDGDWVEKSAERIEYTFNVIHDINPVNGSNKLFVKSAKKIGKDSIANHSFSCSDFLITNNLLNSENSYYNTNLIDSEKIYNGNLIRYVKSQKYFNSSNPAYSQLNGFINEVVINPGSRQIKNEFEYYPSDHQYRWLLKKINSNNGSSQEFEYYTYSLNNNNEIIPTNASVIAKKILVNDK